MGVVGNLLGNLLGGAVGSLAGDVFGGVTGIGGKEGGQIGKDIGGQLLGSLIPFRKGGRVKRTTPALLHKGEYVLPAGVKPTKAQIQKVSAKKARKTTHKRKMRRRK